MFCCMFFDQQVGLYTWERWHVVYVYMVNKMLDKHDSCGTPSSIAWDKDKFSPTLTLKVRLFRYNLIIITSWIGMIA